MTDDEAILMVEAEIDRQQARTRAQRTVDAAKHEYTRWRCRKRGIPVDSNRCKQLMQRAEAVIMRTTEAAKPMIVAACPDPNRDVHARSIPTSIGGPLLMV
jgi:hypothetical protein